MPQDDNLEARVSDLERWRATQEAVSQERLKHMDDRFNRIESRLDNVDKNVSRVVWLIVASIIAALLSFIFRGGLNVVS